MELGVQIHRQLQESKCLQGNYKSELLLKHTFEGKRFSFEVSGRADGVFYSREILVEEIKSSLSVEKLLETLMEDPYHPYRLQALTYAYFLNASQDRPAQAQLLVVCLKSKKETVVPLKLDEVFEEWLGQRLVQLENQKQLRQSQRRKRWGMSKTLAFPFAQMRPHQEELMAAVKGVADKGQRGLFQAPTGIGKTLGVLLPMMRAAFRRGNQLIYLAPKNLQFEVAKEAALKVCSDGRGMKVHVLTSKRKLCRKESMDCHPQYCEYARDYYDKLNKYDVVNKLNQRSVTDRQSLLAASDAYEVCPYQLQMDAVGNSDMIIGDYNYVFSPRAPLADHFFDQTKRERLHLIIDEAHNLYQRGMEYYSPQVFFDTLKSFRDSAVKGKTGKAFRKLIKSALSYLEHLRPPSRQSKPIKVSLDKIKEIQDWSHDVLVKYLLTEDVLADDDPVLTFFLLWSNLVEALEEEEAEVLTSYLHEEGRDSIKLTCCDPSKPLARCLDQFHSAVGISATLTPFNFYRSLSGFGESSVVAEFDSGFPSHNRKVLIIPQISTAYRYRDRHYSKIGEGISRIAELNPGNYLVFFSSYDFLRQTASYIWSEHGCVVQQERRMSQEAVDDLGQCLVAEEQDSIVLAVQGSIFSEGVDYNSPRLKGVFVVGPALPRISFERDLLKNYYQDRFGNGFAYAYAYPSMSRSIQASGRVIRAADKKGLIVLMDGRFLSAPYVDSIPRFWYQDSPRELVSTQIAADLREFWRGDRA